MFQKPFNLHPAGFPDGSSKKRISLTEEKKKLNMSVTESSSNLVQSLKVLKI